MFTKSEGTSERVDAYLDALAAEAAQLQQALSQEKAAGNGDRVKKLEQRVKSNAAETARVKKLAGKSSAAETARVKKLAGKSSAADSEESDEAE